MKRHKRIVWMSLFCLLAFACKSELETQDLSSKSPLQRELEVQTLEISQLSSSTDKNQNPRIRELVEARQKSLLELARENPGLAMRMALPDAARLRLPAELQARIEEKKTLEGELEVLYEDSADGQSAKLIHILKTKDERLELVVPESIGMKHLQSAKKARVKGVLFKGEESEENFMVLNDNYEGLEILAAGGGVDGSNSSTTPLTNTTGEHRVLVMYLKFADTSFSQPWSLNEINSMVFGKVNDYYKEASSGKTWLSGEVRGYTLSINQTCIYDEISTAADNAATNDGININSYDKIVYLSQETCRYRGYGTVGGAPSRAWIAGELNLETIGHELGHNFGLRHAGKLNCQDGYLSADCVSITYGDIFDVMGKSEGHFNAFNKERLGWLSEASGEIGVANEDGSYTIVPYADSSINGVKGLKVRRGTDSLTGEPLYYYLEYRQPFGFDSYLAGKSMTGGALVHLNLEGDNARSQLLDMTPKSSIYDLDDAALMPGLNYTDFEAGVSITTESADAQSLSVNVSYTSAPPVCAQANPSLSLSPSESAWVLAGSSVNYSATVTNNDSDACGSSNFDVVANVPSGWSSAPKSLTLAPGASATVVISVTSASSAQDGFYDIAIQTLNQSDSNFQASSMVSYVIDTPPPACVPVNPALSLTPDQSGGVIAGDTATYSGTLTNLDSGSCAASTFTVSASLPSGFSSPTQSISLAAGASAQVSMAVTTSDSLGAGDYNLSFSAVKDSDSAYSVSIVKTLTLLDAPEPCYMANPGISILSDHSVGVDPGVTQTYTVNVVNNDSSSCASAIFDISANVPAGLTGGRATLALAPGASQTVGISVSSSTSSPEGIYTVDISAVNRNASSYFANDSSEYIIIKAQNLAPVAVNDNVNIASKADTIIDALANDHDPENDPIVIVSVGQGSKGSVQITNDGKILYSPSKGFKSSDSFIYTISDGEKESTATVKISLSSTDGGGGGGGGGGKGKNR